MNRLDKPNCALSLRQAQDTSARTGFTFSVRPELVEGQVYPERCIYETSSSQLHSYGNVPSAGRQHCKNRRILNRLGFGKHTRHVFVEDLLLSLHGYVRAQHFR